MTVLAERHRSSSAPWARRLAAFALVLFALSGLGHRYGLVDTPSFFWLLGIVVGLTILSFIAAAAAFVGLWERGDKGGRDATLAVLLSLLVMAPFAVSVWRLAIYPPLVDVSTDLLQRPSFELAAASRTPAMNAIEPATAANARMQVEYYPEVTGRRYDAAPDIIAAAVLGLLDQRGWPLKRQVTAPAAGDLTVEATAYSFWLGFPADVSVRLVDEGQSTFVDMRSASRYMRHDLGDNARRVIGFLADLDATLRAPPPEE